MSRLSRRTLGLLVVFALLTVVAGTASAAPAHSPGQAPLTDTDGNTTLAADDPADGSAGGTGAACGGGTSWVPDSVGNSTEDVRVIITYESGSARASCAGSAVSAVGGDVIGGQDVDILPMAVARVDPAAMDALESRPGIESVHRDVPIRGAEVRSTNESAGGSGAAQSVPWGVDRINGTQAAGEVSDSEMRNVQVAVMDSGIDLDHPDLKDNLVWGSDHIDGNNRVGLQYAGDVYGHGTHVAGTIAARDNGQGVVGVAPNVELYSTRVLNDSNFGYYSWWIEGIDRAVKGPDGTVGTADDPEVISMSLGGTSDCCGLHKAIKNANNHALLVAAAGNRGDGDTSTNEIEYPGKYAETIAVAATKKDDLTATFSAEGDQIDIAAPGRFIESTKDPDHAGGSEYGKKSGTSMATPHVSGTAALIIAKDLADGSRDLSDADVTSELLDTAKDIHGSGIDRYSGHGRLRANAAMGVQTIDDPPTASFTVDPSTPVTNETVTFDASGSSDDDGIASYNWTFAGTQQTTTDSVTTYSFPTAGTYDVSLTVVDTAGQTNTTSTTVTVGTDDAPSAAFSVSPGSPITGETVTFDASNSTDDAGIARYNWTIGSKKISTTRRKVTRTFSQGGTYDVTLTVVDTVGQTDTVSSTLTVVVDDPPTAAFSVEPSSPVANETVAFDGSNASDDNGIASYRWTIAGTTVNTTDPVRSVTFSQAGLYDVSLTVVDTVGQTDTTNETLLVDRNDPPTAAFSVAPETPLTNESITLNATASTDDASVASYNWTVAGTQINTTDPVTSVTLQQAGTYDVTLTVVDSSGETNTTTESIRVVDPVTLSAPDVISPSKVNETTPLELAVGVEDVVPNATAQSAMNLSISLNGTVLNTTDATVTEGETTNLSLPITPVTAGSYTVTVDGSVAFDGRTYNATSLGSGMTVLTENESLSPPITGSNASTNLDGDPLLEDVDGDGDGDVFDVLAYYNNRDSALIRGNPDRFDFDGDDAAGTVFDALTLYEKLSS